MAGINPKRSFVERRDIAVGLDVALYSSCNFGLKAVMKKIGYGVMIVAALVGVYGVWVSDFGLVLIWIVAEIIGLAIVTESKRKIGE